MLDMLGDFFALLFCFSFLGVCGLTGFIIFNHFKKKDNKKYKPYLIGCIVVFIASFILTGVTLDSTKDSQTKKEQPQTVVKTEKCSYNIINEENTSFGNVKRYQLDVVVDGKPTADELKEICNAVAEDYKETNNYNTLFIFLCDSEYYCKNPDEVLPTLGKAEYTPEGENYNIKDKDWSKQPTEQEAELYYKLRTAFKEARELNPDVIQLDEDKIISELAKENDTTPEKIEAINLKVMTWSM